MNFFWYTQTHTTTAIDNCGPRETARRADTKSDEHGPPGRSMGRRDGRSETRRRTERNAEAAEPGNGSRRVLWRGECCAGAQRSRAHSPGGNISAALRRHTREIFERYLPQAVKVLSFLRQPASLRGTAASSLLLELGGAAAAQLRVRQLVLLLEPVWKLGLLAELLDESRQHL
jgi:hypothetical protein